MATRTINSAYPGGYYLKPTFTALNIGTAAMVGGAGVTTTASQPSTIDNQGTVIGTANGVVLADGGRIANGGTAHPTALIEGSSVYGASTPAAIVVEGAAGTISNFGSIVTTYVTAPRTGARYAGPSVVLEDGGLLWNASTASYIEGGVTIGGGVGSVVNRGRVGGPSYVKLGHKNVRGPSVELADGGSITNGANGDTSAEIAFGAVISGGLGTITNNGQIGGPTSVSYDHLYYSEVAYYGFGAVLDSGGKVLNGTGANTSASMGAIEIKGGLGIIINHGLVGATQTDFVDTYGNGTDVTACSAELYDGGTITNGSATDTGARMTGFAAISGGPGVIRNFGTIGGVYLGAGGAVTNGTATDTNAQIRGGSLFDAVVGGGSTTVDNFGTINATQIVSGGAPSTFSGVQLQDGTVTNGSATDRSASISGYVGLSLTGAGTVVNYGTIFSDSGKGSSTAIEFGSASDVLIEEGSGTLGNDVIGGGGTMELAAGAGTGSIGEIGKFITGFASIEVEAGAGWHLINDNTIAAGTVLTNAAAVIDDGVLINNGTIALDALLRFSQDARLTNTAGGTITLDGDVGITIDSGASGARFDNEGLLEKTGGTGTSNLTVSIVNTGTIVAGAGTLYLDNEVSGAGAINIGTGATLEQNASITAAGTVSFAGQGGVLDLYDPAGFKAKVSGFGAGETIDLRSIAFSGHPSLSYSATSGALAVTSGANAARIALLGQYAAANFALSADGHGGTDVTFVAAPSAAHALALPGGG